MTTEKDPALSTLSLESLRANMNHYSKLEDNAKSLAVVYRTKREQVLLELVRRGFS